MLLKIFLSILIIAVVGIVSLIALISAIVLVAAFISIVVEMKHGQPTRPRHSAWRKRSIMEKEIK